MELTETTPMPTIAKTIAASILMLCPLALTGCETAPEEMPYQTMELAEPVTMSYKVIGGHPALAEPCVALINSQAELDGLGVEGMIGVDVNFNNQQVLIAALGEMPTAGYWIDITAVHQEGDVLQVYGHANRPAGDQMTGQVLTYPYCAVVIDRTGATTVGDQIDSVEGLEPPM